MTVTVTVFEMRHDREERYGPCHGSYMTPSWGFLPRTASPCWKPAGQHSKAGQQDPQHPAPPCICSQPATGSEGERPSPEGLVSQEEKGEGEGGALRRGLEKGVWVAAFLCVKYPDLPNKDGTRSRDALN